MKASSTSSKSGSGKSKHKQSSLDAYFAAGPGHGKRQRTDQATLETRSHSVDANDSNSGSTSVATVAQHFSSAVIAGVPVPEADAEVAQDVRMPACEGEEGLSSSSSPPQSLPPSLGAVASLTQGLHPVPQNDIGVYLQKFRSEGNY